MRANFLPAVAAFLILPWSAALAQSGLRVQPLMVEVPAPADASSVTLTNAGAQPVTLQIRLFDWTQVQGKDTLAPATDVIASPPATTIPAGASFTVRVARLAGPATSGERAYRLWVDELPPAIPPRQAGGGVVGVQLRYDLPVFFHAPNLKSDLQWRAQWVGDRLMLQATNRGERHARVEKISVEGLGAPVSFGEGLLGYVLPGSTRQWTSLQPVKAPTANTKVTVVAGVGGSETRAPLEIVAR